MTSDNHNVTDGWDQENYICSKMNTIVSIISHGIGWGASGTYSVKIDRSIPLLSLSLSLLSFPLVSSELKRKWLEYVLLHVILLQTTINLRPEWSNPYTFSDRWIGYAYFTTGIDCTCHRLDCVFNRVHILGSHIFGNLEWRKFLVSRDLKIRRISVKFCYRITKSD